MAPISVSATALRQEGWSPQEIAIWLNLDLITVERAIYVGRKWPPFDGGINITPQGEYLDQRQSA